MHITLLTGCNQICFTSSSVFVIKVLQYSLIIYPAYFFHHLIFKFHLQGRFSFSSKISFGQLPDFVRHYGVNDLNLQTSQGTASVRLEHAYRSGAGTIRPQKPIARHDGAGGGSALTRKPYVRLSLSSSLPRPRPHSLRCSCSIRVSWCTVLVHLAIHLSSISAFLISSFKKVVQRESTHNATVVHSTPFQRYRYLCFH